MQPKQFTYPEFVADQVLTKDNLNDLFEYLDEQERLTRANLIGVGIVCGLEVSVNAAGTQLTISGGCGVTSGGYLITFPTKTFTQYKEYNPVKAIYYEKFVDIPNKQEWFRLDELFESAVVEGGIALTKNYLKDKVVLLYVELLENNNKNCDPQSCDDKGMNVEITFHPLLININDVAKLKTTGLNYGDVDYKTLPVLKMQRFNVPASLLQSTAKVLQEYQKILSVTFIKKVRKTLSEAYELLLPLVKDIYPANPFSTLVEDFAFLNDNSITEREAINFQYYYDLFSDIELAYSELREAGVEALSLCCPDENLFRLHLLLGDAIPVVNNAKLENRQYFIPSPVLECHCKQTQTLRWLFKRIQLLLENFYPDYGAKGSFGHRSGHKRFDKKLNDTVIRITPSSLGKYPLGDKAIPFYYLPVDGTDTLLDNWNIQKTADGEADQNLSYNANLYATDDYVLNPTSYDLEPYNFLRIEGHVGMKYATALKSIINLRDRNRLPFDVVTVGSDLESLKTSLSSLGKSGTVEALLEKYADQIKAPCQFNDLDALWDTFLAEIICQLCKTMLYFYNLTEEAQQGAKAAPPKVPLVLKCNPNYMVQPPTFGYYFEEFYQAYQGNDMDALRYTYRRMAENHSDFTVSGNYFFLLDLEIFYETLTPSLAAFDYNASLKAYKRLIAAAKELIASIAANTEQDNVMKATLEELKKLVAMCFQKPATAIYKDYLLRWVSVMMLQKFGHFARKHPGIQHKAGVPMGGTFIMVYHEAKANATTPPPPAPPAPAKAGSDIIAEGVKDLKEAIMNSGERVAGAIEKEMAAGGTVIQDKKAMFEEAKAVDVPEVEVQAHPEYVYTTPAHEAAGMTSVNDLEIFKSENEKEFDDLAILLADITDDSTNLEDVVSEIADGVVFADFYLPYMCCSDCPPIQYTVTEVLQTVTVAITPTVFCKADTASYGINVTPDGGDINGEGTSTDAGKFVFKPSGVAIGASDAKKDVTITYNAFGQSASTKVTVYQKPTAKFDAAPATGSDTVTITNTSSAFADKYAWTFGDGQTSTDKNPAPVTYAADGTYEINLTVYNNICSDTTKLSVTVTTPDVTIDMSKRDFCVKDDVGYQITVSPIGTTVDGEGVSLSGGTYSFTPNKVDLGGNAKKTVTLTAKHGSKSQTLNVTVYQMPVAELKADVVDGGDTVKVTNESSQFIEKYLWDFGDGSTSTDKDPAPHLYQKEGSFDVVLTVTNGPCSDKADQPVTISFADVNIAMSVLNFCSNNDTPQEIVYTPADVEIDGDGVSVKDGKYVFTPKSVPMGGKDKVTVTLTAKTAHKTKSIDVVVYQSPTASFTEKPQSGNPKVIEFVNNSAFATKYLWDFGDGGPTSTDQTPAPHTFKAGDHTVTLTVTNEICTSDPFQVSFSIAPQYTIDIDPKEFCIADTKPAKIILGEDGGAATGEGVSSPAPGEFVFTPSGVTMPADLPKRDVPLQNNTAALTVLVYNKPAPTFNTTVTGTAPFTLLFNNTTKFADSFSWDFGDKSAGSKDQSPIHTFPTAGKYDVRLTATNGLCTVTADPVSITVGQPGEQILPKTCSPLGPIFEGFAGLKNADTKNFTNFTKQYKSYNAEIVPFFTAIKDAGSLSGDDQIKLFSTQKADTLLAKWIAELTAMLKQPELARVFAKLIAALVSILAELAEYIACIQSEDVNKAEVSMENALNALVEFIEAFLTLENDPQQKALVDPAMPQFNQIDTDAKAEQGRVTANGESTTKKVYADLLAKIVKLFG